MIKRKSRKELLLVIDQETGKRYSGATRISVPTAKRLAREVSRLHKLSTICVYRLRTGARGGREIGCAEKGRWFTR